MLSTQNSVGMAEGDSGSLGNTPKGMDWTSIIPYTLRLVLRNQKYVWITFSHNRICLPRHRNYVCVCVRGSVVSNSATSWTVTHQDPLSKGFARQEYWSGSPLRIQDGEKQAPVCALEILLWYISKRLMDTSTSSASPDKFESPTQCVWTKSVNTLPSKIQGHQPVTGRSEN